MENTIYILFVSIFIPILLMTILVGKKPDFRLLRIFHFLYGDTNSRKNSRWQRTMPGRTLMVDNVKINKENTIPDFDLPGCHTGIFRLYSC